VSDPITSLVNGHRATRLVLHVPEYGAWRCDVDFDTRLEPSQLTGAATIAIGSFALAGTFTARTGSFQLKSIGRVLGGAGALSTVLKARHYHSDAGVALKTVVADAIREAGETAGAADITTERVGIDYVRQSAPASRVLSQVLGARHWWVDYTGAVRVGTRAAVEIAGGYEVLDYDPRFRVATIATDDPAAIVIGAVLRQRMDAPLVVRDLELVVADGKLRVTAWGSVGEPTAVVVAASAVTSTISQVVPQI
jgi:hypothetical protein